MRELKVFDNFLSREEWDGLTATMLGKDMPWYYYPSYVSDAEAVSLKGDPTVYKFSHLFFRHGAATPSFSILSPIVKRLDPAAFVFVRAFLMTYTGVQAQSEWHVDVQNVVGHLTAIYYLNTNNGRTVFETGESVESVGNRLVIFDASKRHAAVTATDVKARVVINFNYFPTINSI